MTPIPLQDIDNFDLIVFGGTGDLAYRKIYPALYYRLKEDQITEDSRILAVGRRDLTQKDFQDTLSQKLHEYIEGIDEQVYKRLA